MTTASVQGQLVADLDSPAGEAPGSFEYAVSAEGYLSTLLYRCPCGCGSIGVLPFRNLDKPEQPSWMWNHNKEAPTLTPSIHHQLKLRDGSLKTHWHGYLKDGVFTSV